MISKIWTGALLFLAWIFFCAWLVLVCREKDVHPLRDFAMFFKKQTTIGRVLFGTFFLIMWVYASVKPGDGGGNGGGNGGGDGGTNNVPQMVCPPGGSSQMSLPGGMLRQQVGLIVQHTGLMNGVATINLSGLNPITSTNTLRTITAADFERGFVQTRIGSNEHFDFSPIANAAIVSDWRAFGAATDWIYVALTNWAFQVAANDVERLRICSFGKIEPFIREADNSIATNYWFAPFMASLGIVPQANWNWLAESDRPSQVWYAITPSNSLLITWQNALLDRDTDKPLSFQTEFKADGQFSYRYDLSRLNIESVTNILAGASFGGNEWTTNSIPTNVTSKAFYPLSEEDITNQDRDGDGINLIDELFVYGTDPMLPDSDFDGVPDGMEIALGTNPAGRDSDSDGLVDGSDPDPTATTPLDDLDGDGIPDAYENHWFGDTNAIDSLDGYGANGFNLGFEVSSGINPTNGAEEVFMPTNRIAAWKITDGFIAGGAQFTASNIYERTFRIARNGGWEQFFVSSRPDGAGGWRLEGLALDWEDSEGVSGSATASPAADSLYLPVSTNSPATLTLRLRQTASMIACRSPLYLLAYSPSIEIADATQISASNGVWNVVTIKEESSVALTIDRAERPAKAPLYPAETSAEIESEDGKFVFQADGTLQINAPGVYPLPTMDLSAYAQPVLRTRGLRSPANPPSGSNGCYLACINPSISYGSGHHADGGGLSYDPDSGTYSEVYEYPIDSGCLWREWHSDASGGYECTCEPEMSVGFDIDAYSDISTNLVVNGGTATGTISIGGVEVWSGTATHDTSTDGGGGRELLSDNECDECSSCEDGNCDALEGGELGSLKFRIPLGVPRKGQVSGFAWFLTNEPIAVGVDTLQVLSRNDAQVSDTTSGGIRTIACGDNRGRTLSIQPVANGIEVTITETDSGKLEHTWRILNVNGSASQIRLWKISRLDNTMSDDTYVYANGDWTKFDNISQTSEELVSSGDVNADGWKREERVLRDANNAILSHTITESERFGSFANAVIRETYHAERSWGDNWNESYASYYTDNDNPKRNGNARLVWGNARAWRFCAYDVEGRTTLTLDQYDGSGSPNWPLEQLDADVLDNADVLAWLQSYWFTAIATVSDYTPLAGDDADPNDADKVRTESRYLVDNGTVTLIGRAWTRYTHGTTNGYATVSEETITAGAQNATISDARNARRSETRYESDAPGIPLMLRGAVVESLDEDGVLEQNTYSISNGILSQTSQKSYMSQSFPVAAVTERCMTYGNVLREWSVHVASGITFDEKRYLYDDKNRLRSTIYSDGSFTTNAYSCCRLLNAVDRTGRKVLRSAVTGQDHLYYAMEEVGLGELPNANDNIPTYAPYEGYGANEEHYRVTQHFMDALGRETNTVVRTCKTPGAATSPDWVCGGWRTSEATAYPYGVSDYEVSTDMRGNATTTIHTSYFDSDEVETVETNKTTIVTTYRNGSSILYEEWPDGKWKETTQTKSYASDGCRIDTTTVAASDHDEVAARTIYHDFLGRTVREVSPTANIAYTHDGASSRVLSTTDSISGETVTRIYDELGEAIGQTKNGVTSRSETDYDAESNILWRVSSQTVTSTITNLCAVTKERLTGLSDELRSETFSYMNSAFASHTYSSFDPTNCALTEVTESAATGTTTTRSKYGIVIETTTSAGTATSFFDPYGRAFYTEKDGRSVDWIGRNDWGDVEEYDTFHSEGNAYYAEFYGYDNFGNRIAATNALGAVTICAYDPASRLVESGGAVYLSRYNYDTEGRRTGLSTTRNGSAWDATGWTFDAATGFCTFKTYADGSTVTYSYTTDGKPLRTTYAGGRWRENAYNARRELISTEYSDGEVCAFAYDEFSHEIAASNDVVTVVLRRNEHGQVTNETTTVGSCVPHDRSIERRFDVFGRLVENDGSEYAYATDGQLAAISNSIASVEYRYTSDRLDAGYTLTLSNGVTVTRCLVRDTYRRSLVTGITNSVNGVEVENLAYVYDALNRPVSRNADTFGYNDRSEVTNAVVAGILERHDYDEIGNSLWATCGNAGFYYTANSCNQYSNVYYTDDLNCPSDQVASAYDLDGNMTQFGGWTYAYDAANRLKTASTNGVVVLTNFYDVKSRRVKKVTAESTTTFFYDDWNLIEERIAYTNGTTSTIRYFWGKDISGDLQNAGGVGGLLYLTVDGSIYIPSYDNIGNVTRYLDANGNTVAQYTYDAFGNLISSTGPLADFFRHRFSTKYFDVGTGLYYYGYRFYSPRLMRWLNRDPLEEEGGVNLYTACANALIISFDILGRDDGTVIVEGLGAGWAGSKITLNGRTAVQLNGELYYLTMTHQQGMYIPKGGPTSSLYLFKADNVKKGLRLDYHELPVHSNNPPEWHVNVDGHSGIAKVANSKSLNHTTSPKIKALGKTVTVFKYGGRICFVAGIGMSVVDIYRADNRVRETVRQIGGWSGAVLGGKVGASLGSSGGMATAVALGQMGPQIATPEEIVTVPVFGFIGGVGGGLVGGITGFFFGAKTTETVYDWIFTPLEKEEWEVGCEQK